MVKNAIRKVVERLRQPTTVVGAIALGALFGMPPDTMNHLGNAIVFVAGLAAVLLDEAKPVVVAVPVPVDPASPKAEDSV